MDFTLRDLLESIQWFEILVEYRIVYEFTTSILCDINSVQFIANISDLTMEIVSNVICQGRIIMTKKETDFILWQQEHVCRRFFVLQGFIQSRDYKIIVNKRFEFSVFPTWKFLLH